MASDCELSTYAEVIEVIENLRFLVREKRRRDRLTMRDVATAADGDMNASTIHRFEHGKDISTANLVALIRWVGNLPAATDHAATTDVALAEIEP